MGNREVRPVPFGWEHPRRPGTYSDGSPRYVPLYSRATLRDHVRSNAGNPHPDDYIKIDPDRYMPAIPEGTPYGYQLYETTSEGTPLSPVFRTLDELAAWCEHGATVFASDRWTKEQWLASFVNDTLDADSIPMSRGGSLISVADPLRSDHA
ncbi:MAG TPA: hypothetical protein VFB06_11580 [Streptosporangiaceae bacterium]|nr:hypothetical protein [Streptosporangiaceae bacterium]